MNALQWIQSKGLKNDHGNIDLKQKKGKKKEKKSQAVRVTHIHIVLSVKWEMKMIGFPPF